MELLHQNQILFLAPDEQGSPELYPLPELMTIDHALDRALEAIEQISREHALAVQGAVDDLDPLTTSFRTTQEAYEYYNQQMDLKVCRRAVLMMRIVDLCAPHVADIIARDLGSGDEA